MPAQNGYRIRKPAHIAFMSIPAHGHVNPGLGLVSELARRGHGVTYAVPESFAPQVIEAGATHIGYETMLPTGEKGDEWTTDYLEAANMFLDEAIAVVPQLRAAYQDDVPDVVVHDIGAQHAPVLAACWGVPAVSLSPTHVAFEGFEEVFGIGHEVDGLATHRAEFQAFLDRYETGLDYESMMRPPNSLVTIPRSFQYCGDRVADDVIFAGPMLTERAFQGDWQPPTGKRVLLISLGSAYTNQPEFFRDCVRAFGDDPSWHVVLTIGKHVDRAAIGPVPEHFEVHRWVPQLRILSYADAFISHCGMGGTMEGLYSGVPIIGVGQLGEQYANAARIAELGLGVHIPLEEATSESLRAALERVSTDAAIQENIAAMRAEINAAGGVRAGVELIESALATSSSPEKPTRV
ncbi:MGT family glycosyltransferase [Tamaricihabitans halophyticus]|uniref:MGT family glycosyltransferase n=1 Tax=Tamaricihabitans halophyticus TaxID=1262583 RepID=A0A4V6NR52_9PSEU|nr:macrolide family glycosyltransferase [Tamaricihabitans halophyticus]TCP45766.1 MGT family glycosyltransferase [Tamaricihabitans halophyticus]